MANFIDCWSQLKAKGYKHANGEEVLNSDDRASILSRINDHIQSGVNPQEAAKLSVKWHLDEANGQLKSVYDQIRERYPNLAGKEPPPATEPAAPPTAETPVAPSIEKPPVSTKNVYTEQARVERGIPAAEQSARRDFGTVWDEAGQVLEKDPNAAHRLVADVNEGKTKATTDLENALLLRRQIGAQKEYSDAVDAVNSAKTDADKTVAQSRLTQARDDLQQVYDADKKAGTSTGRGLNARRMLANEDYSIARMEASRRAANKGEPLSDVQLKEVKDHYDAISKQESRIKSAEDALSSPRQPLDPKEILNGIERMKARIAPCL